MAPVPSEGGGHKREEAEHGEETEAAGSATLPTSSEAGVPRRRDYPVDESRLEEHVTVLSISEMMSVETKFPRCSGGSRGEPRVTDPCSENRPPERLEAEAPMDEPPGPQGPQGDAYEEEQEIETPSQAERSAADVNGDRETGVHELQERVMCKVRSV